MNNRIKLIRYGTYYNYEAAEKAGRKYWKKTGKQYHIQKIKMGYINTWHKYRLYVEV